MDLNKYVVDTVRAVENEEGKPAVMVVSFLVLSDSAKSAYERFLEGGEFPVVFEGEKVDSVIIGVGLEPTD